MLAQAPADRQMGGKARILARPWQRDEHAGWRMGLCLSLAGPVALGRHLPSLACSFPSVP